MQLKINGEEHTVSAGITLAGLIAELGMTQHKIAVEINRQIIPSARFSQTRLAEHDTVEIIHAVGGG